MASLSLKVCDVCGTTSPADTNANSPLIVGSLELGTPKRFPTKSADVCSHACAAAWLEGVAKWIREGAKEDA